MLAPSVRSTLGGALKPNPLATLTRSSLCTSKIVRKELWKFVSEFWFEGHVLQLMINALTGMHMPGDNSDSRPLRSC